MTDLASELRRVAEECVELCNPVADDAALLMRRAAAVVERQEQLEEAASYVRRSLDHYAPSVEKMKRRLDEALPPRAALAQSEEPRP